MEKKRRILFPALGVWSDRAKLYQKNKRKKPRGRSSLKKGGNERGWSGLTRFVTFGRLFAGTCTDNRQIIIFYAEKEIR